VTICVLFVCIHNSARSQMAEAFVNHYGAPKISAQSAGLEPGKLNPIVVDAMREREIDISAKKTKSVAEMPLSTAGFDFVITVCDDASAERCPVFPGQTKRLHWGFPDPSALAGSPAEKLIRVREIRDAIETRCRAWCAAVVDPKQPGS